jgi:hypothetical protein
MCIRHDYSGEISEAQRTKLNNLSKEHNLKLSISTSYISIDPADSFGSYGSTCTKLLYDVTCTKRRGLAYNLRGDDDWQKYMPQMKQFVSGNALKVYMLGYVCVPIV